VFDGYLSFKILNKVSKTCFHDKVWKLHLYVKPKIPKNMNIKEHFRQNVIKRVEKNPAGISQDLYKNPRIFIRSQSRDFLFRDFSGFNIPGLFSPGIPGYPVDIPSWDD
jgi:hypothetical protein